MHNVAIIVTAFISGGIVIAALFNRTIEKATDRARGEGYYEGMFARERAEKKRRDANGRYKTLEN